VQAAEMTAGRLPGAPLAVAAVRGTAAGGSGISEGPLVRGGVALSAQPEGPGAPSSVGLLGAAPSGTPGTPSATVLGAGAADPNGSLDTSLQQSAQLNLYYLQIQQQIDAQNRSFTALSNVLKTEHDSAKAAIQNIHS
jgi:hypothetical protein